MAGAGRVRIKRAIAKEPRVDGAIVVDDEEFGNVVVSVGGGISGVARQLDQRRAGRETRRQGTAVIARIRPVAEHHDRRALPLEGKTLLLQIAFDVVPRAVAIAKIDQIRNGLPIGSAERITAAGYRKAAIVSELLAVGIDDRIARQHERVGIGHAVEGWRAVVMAGYKMHGLAAIHRPVIVPIKTGMGHIPPIVLKTIAGQVALHRKEQREIERIAIAADHAGSGRVDILADKLLKQCLVTVIDFAERENSLLLAV